MFDSTVMQAAMNSLQFAIKNLNDAATNIENRIPSTKEQECDTDATQPTSRIALREVAIHDGDALQEIASVLCRSRKHIVITGAGISTSCGIPDFRSKDGLYKMNLQQTRLPTPPETECPTPSRRKRATIAREEDQPASKRLKVCSVNEELSCSQTSTLSRSSSFNSTTSRLKGEDLFHARVFQDAATTTMFYQFTASFRKTIRDDVKDTSETHKFIRALRDGGRLMRCYTQNIDGLEEKEALCVDLKRGKGTKTRFTKKIYGSSRPEIVSDTVFDGGCEVVQLHGELSKLRCRVCSTESAWTDEDTEIFLEGAAPECEICANKSDQRQAKGKRGLAVGELRPNIVLYGEDHPQSSLIAPLLPFDISSNPEVLIIMGTSLKVHGLQKIIRNFAKAVHARREGRVIFVNRTRPAESVWEGIIDDWIAMDCDEWVRDLRDRKPEMWFPQGDPRLHKQPEVMVSRKRKAGNCLDESTGKRRKIYEFVSVDIPKIVSKKHTTATGRAGRAVARVLAPSTFLSNVPRLNRSAHVKVTETQVFGLNTTPKRNHRTIWKRSRQNGHEVISPALRQRPEASPLNLHFKCARTLVSDLEFIPGSPLTPPFSPLPASHVTPRQFIIFDESVTATPSPHTRTLKHPRISDVAPQVPADESFCDEGTPNDPDLSNEIGSSVRRQLSFLEGGIQHKKQIPLYARFGRGLKSLFSTEYMGRA